MPKRWKLLKKLLHPHGGNPPKARIGHFVRSVVPGRDAGRPEEQADLSLGHEGFTSASGPRSTHPIDLCVRCGLSRAGRRRRLVLPACNTEAMQLHLDEIATK